MAVERKDVVLREKVFTSFSFWNVRRSVSLYKILSTSTSSLNMGSKISYLVQEEVRIGDIAASTSRLANQSQWMSQDY